jgi:hypothetical protein
MFNAVSSATCKLLCTITNTQGDQPRLLPDTSGKGWVANQGLIKQPSRMVSLRMIDPVTFKVADTSRGGEIIDQIEYSRAFFELFAGICDSPHSATSSPSHRHVYILQHFSAHTTL